MNNSKLFKAAHKQARATVSQVGDYQIAFTLALKELIAKQKQFDVVLADHVEVTGFIAGLVFVIVSVMGWVSMGEFHPIVLVAGAASAIVIGAASAALTIACNFIMVSIYRVKYTEVFHPSIDTFTFKTEA